MCEGENNRQVSKVTYVKDAFAYMTDEGIFLHEDLPNYPELHRAILEHETQHQQGGFTFKDLLLDLKGGLPKDELKAFKKAHPWVVLRMMSPINKFGTNYNLLILYILLVGLVYGTMRLVLWIGLNLL
jgi:hypothetical protein